MRCYKPQQLNVLARESIMKHLFWLSAILCTQAFADAGPIPVNPTQKLEDMFSTIPADPMENYTPSTVSYNRMMTMWNNMNDKMDGDDCYRRAHIWAYDMYDFYGVKSMKIFIHYTNKFNRELDKMADMYRRDLKGKIDYRTYNMLKYNKTWDYHVAPLVQLDNGEYRVLDKELIMAYDAGFPYTQDEAWKLIKRPATIDEWLDGLTIRGELLWQARKERLKIDISKASGNRRAALLAKYRELGMDKYDQVDIKCERAQSIAEVDLNHSNNYCYYTIAPMYYYNEIDLRSLAFGYTNQNYAMPVNSSVYTEQNFENGRTNYVVEDWNYSELKDAAKEIKWGGGASSYKSRIKREQR